MRAIGQLQQESSARAISDYLYVKGIDNHTESDDEGLFTLWVEDEDRLQEAAEILDDYRRDPLAAKFLQARPVAEKRRLEEEEKEQAARKRYHNSQSIRRRTAGGTVAPLTLGLILTSAVLTLFFHIEATRNLIAEWCLISIRDGFLTEVKRGQIWRLVSPVFLHGDLLHIFFNMWWMKDLGTAVERRFGLRHFVQMFLLLAVFSNLAQYIASGPLFYGMSGVVYGLLGYLWIRAKVDPRSGLYMPESTVMFMGLWFFLCWFGVVGSVANMAHTGGLVAGAALGYFRWPRA